MTRVCINSSISSDVSLAGPLRTAIPAEDSGGNRKGFEKSRSRVTKALPSEKHLFANSSSVAEVSDWIATVHTSCPSATRRSIPRFPRFSSSFSFTQPTRVPPEQNARATWLRHRRCRPGYPPVEDQGRILVLPEPNYRLLENQGSEKPRSGDLGCTAFRRNGLGRSISALE